MLGFGSFVKKPTKNRPKSMNKFFFLFMSNFFFIHHIIKIDGTKLSFGHVEKFFRSF